MSYGTSPYGTGPYGSIGGVIIPWILPLGGYGGYAYGTSSYGGAPLQVITIPVSGGYGGYPYGLGTYGSEGTGSDPAYIQSIRSIDGFTLEVLFGGEEMSIDALLEDPASYTLTPLVGAAASTVSYVEVGMVGSLGATSILLHHTGTTLGGLYRLTIIGPMDIGGTAIEAFSPFNQAELYTKGEPPSYMATSLSGSEVLLEFEYPMLDEAGFSPGILQTDAYAFLVDYPQTILPQTITHPYTGDSAKVKLDVIGMTSLDYTVQIIPALAFEYDATYLPTDPEAPFTAQKLGSGTSTLVSGALSMSKIQGSAYGWRFLDTSGKLLPSSSYRASFTFEAGSWTPTSDGTVALFYVSDSAIRVEVHFRRTGGVDYIDVVSGAFSYAAQATWSTSSTTIEVVRNQKADTFTVLVQGEVYVATLIASMTEPAGMPAGVEVYLDPLGVYTIDGFLLQGLKVTSSQTIFSEAWNFLHLHQAILEGDGEYAKTILTTAKGPLVKGWGDATPATKQDVKVYVNGVEVEVAGVNPYIGEIYPQIPIPLMPPGQMDVEVDYIWFPKPVFPFLLNTPGASLNLPGCKSHCPPFKSEGQFLGGTYQPPGWKFPMGVVLGPSGPKTHQPLLRSPRYVGFEHAYTSALNSPTTLTLNQDPHKTAKPYDTIENEGIVVYYEGEVPPTEDGWTLVGEEDVIPSPAPSYINPDASMEGYYQVYKPTTGTYGDGHTTLYVQPVEAYTASSILVVTRLQVQRDVYTPHGVFTGVGFGAHVNQHLFLVGMLEVEGVMHLGVLVDPARMDEVDSWALAYSTSLQVIASNQFVLSTEDIPVLVQERLQSNDVVKIQILEGTQAGVYTITSMQAISDSLTAFTVSTSFPADYKLWGNAYATGYFETAWDGDGYEKRPTTYRLVIQNDDDTYPTGRAALYVGGALTGLALEFEGVPALAIPPQSILTLTTGTEGQVFWGSFDRQAANLSDWYFFRYGVTPSQLRIHARGTVVPAEMNVVPDQDPNYLWYITQDFGTREIDASADKLLLRSTSSSEEFGVEGVDLSFGYARVEPFLTTSMALDVDVILEVDSGSLGAGDASVWIRDTSKEIRMATLLYVEGVGSRTLLGLPSRSLSGLLLPSDQGWTQTGTFSINGRRILMSKTVSTSSSMAADLSTDVLNGGRIAQIRFTALSVTSQDPNGETFLRFEVDVGYPGATYGIGLRWVLPNTLVMYQTDTQLTVATLSATWNDDQEHVYRILSDDVVGTVSLVMDDVVLGTWSITDFTAVPDSTQVRVLWDGNVASGTLAINDVSCVAQAPSWAKRTLGIWLGGNVDDIDSWEVPRTDALTVPNSDLSAVIEEMDWRERIRVRIHRDPSWGVTLLRPDLPPPPYFTGDWSTNITQPSAGWINVEYRHLPRDTSSWGTVAFGSLDPRSISQQRWDRVRYRLYKYPSEDVVIKFPQVLNRFNVLTSGEVFKDVSVEVYTVMSSSATVLQLASIHIYAETVFNLQYIDSEGETVVLYDTNFTFDETTQTITLVNATFASLVGPTDPVSGEEGDVIDPSTIHVPVTVSFAPGKPYTTTYICSQPLLAGTTLLNEGTPPMVLSQVGETVTKLTWGSDINDPNDLLGELDFILNDPFRYLDSYWPNGAVFEDISYCEASEGETCLLSPFCDDNVLGASQAGSEGQEPWDIGNGLIQLGISGVLFSEFEGLWFSDGPSGPFGEHVSSMFLEASGDEETSGGYLQDAILFTPLGPETPPEIPNQGWSVFGVLYDLVTLETQVLYFGTKI